MYTKKKTQKTFLFLLLTCLLSFFFVFCFSSTVTRAQEEQRGKSPLSKSTHKVFPRRESDKMTTTRSIFRAVHYFTNKGPSSQSYGFSSSCVWMRELDHKESWALKNWCFKKKKEFMLLNCGVEDSLQSLGQQGDQTSQYSKNSVLNIHWKDWC